MLWSPVRAVLLFSLPETFTMPFIYFFSFLGGRGGVSRWREIND